MKEEVAAGRTLLFATHYLEEADQAADRILVINRGRLLADGTPAEIKARAGARRLSFRLDKVDEPFLLGLPGLVNLEVRHDMVQIQSSDSDATLYAILDAGYRPREIEVTSLGLEQAFLAITAEDDATNGHSRRGDELTWPAHWPSPRPNSSRLLHNRRYFIFTVAFPVILYLLIGRQVTDHAYGIAFGAYYMIAMATFGAFSGALNGNAQRISQEKKEGWIRQLRLTPLPANAYVVTKILVSLATTIPAIVIVLLLGRFYGNVHLPAWEWPVIAVTVWFGSTIFAALAVAIGYRFAPEQVQPITLIIYFVFAILGGLWFPLTGFLGNVGQFTPDLRGREDRRRRDQGHRRAGRPGHRPGGLARHLRRPGHARRCGPPPSPSEP